MKRLLLNMIGVVTLLVAVTSCGDDNDGPAAQLCVTIATFEGNSGGEVIFSYQEIDDSPIVRIHGAGMIDENEVKIGTRLLVSYNLETGVSPFDGGAVDLRNVQRVLTDTVSIVQTAPAPGKLYLNTIHRSGEYIDIQATMPLTKERKIAISGTAAADAEGIVDLYLTTVTGNTAEAYDATAWASLWIGPVWTRADVKGVRVHLENGNNIYRNTFTFTKSN